MEKKKVNKLYGEPEKIKKCSNDMFEVFEDDLIPIRISSSMQMQMSHLLNLKKENTFNKMRSL